MSHDAYSPVGYSYNADNYCLDCIPAVVLASKGNTSHEVWNAETEDWEAEQPHAYIQDDGCNCAECVLDRIASDLASGDILPFNFDRMDERSFDSGDFPKSISYFNEIHIECGPEHYGYGPEDPEWREQYCSATCARCHAVIDGTEYTDDDGYLEIVCPVWLQRKEKDFK